MRPSKLLPILVLGIAGCPDWESLQSGVTDMFNPNMMADLPPAGWTPVFTSTGVPLHAISGVAGASDQITVVGNTATVIRGTGTTFRAATIPGGNTNLHALWMNGPLEVWAAGSNGEVWQTTNAGTNWTNTMSGTSFTLRGIFARNNNNRDIVAAGDDANIARHWDGFSWQDANHARQDLIYAVWASSQRFWVAGTNGDSATSTDPRVGWNNVSDINNNPRLNAVSGIDDANVWGVTEAGGIYKYDAGNTQWNLVTNVTGVLRAMWVRSAAEIWVAGVSAGNGIVYRCDGVARTCVDQSSSALNQQTITGIWGNSAGGLWITANSSTSGVIFKN